MDRGRGPAAGKDGFIVEKAVPDAAQRGKLRQVAWSRAMIRSGHGGGHLEILLGRWNCDYVAPWLREVR